MIFIPIISAILYLLGGQVNKWFRWGIGIPIAIIAFLNGYGWVSFLTIVTFFVATNCFSYGDKIIWTKLFGKWISMGLAGLTFGLASFAVLPIALAVIQTVVAFVSFLVLKWLDDKDIVKNPFQELLRGFCGTVIYFIA